MSRMYDVITSLLKMSLEDYKKFLSYILGVINKRTKELTNS